MQNELNPAIFWAIVGVIVVVLVGFFIWHGRSAGKMETGGSENAMTQFKAGGGFYKPAGGPVGSVPQGK